VAFFCFVAGSTTLEAKMKIVGAVMLLGLVFIIISPAFGLEKTTPGITSTVYCRCTCATISGLGATEKEWVWSGSPSDCKTYSGADCTLGAGGPGQLSNCDVEVQHAPPGTQLKPSPTTGTNKPQ
jgi:hypothetical protein